MNGPRRLGAPRDSLAPPLARILIVDDEAAHVRALCDTLRDQGYEPAGFTDAHAAVVAAETQPFELVLSDLMMPGLDGIALLQRIQESNPNAVGIIMTGQGSIGSAVEAMAAGAFDYILKPLKLSLILPVLARALSFRRLRIENTDLQMRLRVRAEELEAANREIQASQVELVNSAKMASLGQFVAGVAHEFNNPLAFLMGHQQTAVKNLEGVLPTLETQCSSDIFAKLDKAHRRLCEMRSGLERLRDLVLSLRTFARLDEAELKTVDLRESIESVLTVLRSQLTETIAIVTCYGETQPLLCQPRALNQLFMHLLTNAIEATEAGGTITVTTCQANALLSISIQDTGRGIPETQQSKVFEPFFTTKSVGEGIGLGLSIAHSIVKQHRGNLTLRSAEGQGTELLVSLPLPQA